MRKSRSSVGFAALITATLVLITACGKAPPSAPPDPPAAKTATGEAPTSLPKTRPVPEGDKPLSEIRDLGLGGQCRSERRGVGPRTAKSWADAVEHVEREFRGLRARMPQASHQNGRPRL